MWGGTELSTTLFQIKNINYNGQDGYLENLNLTLQTKEIHAVIVNSTSDQNTFIQALLHLGIRTDIGEAFYKEKKLVKNPFIGGYISLLQQRPQLVQELTVAENLCLTNFPKRRIIPLINWKKIKRQSKSFLEELDFNIDFHSKVKNLTDEQKRLVYIAKVFLQKSEMIVMQEPMEGLSSDNAVKLHKIINQFKEQGGSILYITKQWEETLKLADRISILSNGKITEELTAETAKLDPQRLLTELESYSFNKSNIDADTQDILDAVFNAAEFLTSEYELKDVLLLLAKKVANFMNADGCSIKLIDEPTWSIIDDFEYNKSKHLQLQLTKEAIMQIAADNNIFYTNDKDRKFKSLFNKIQNIKTLICVPVLIRSQVTGIIQIYYENLYVYSKEESKYLSTLARHAAVAIEDTRLMGRSALLQESHHRIKNNLQSVIGLVSLQKSYAQLHPSTPIDSILDNIISRIKSIATVHNLLSKEKLGRSIINVREIIEEVISLMDMDDKITIIAEVEDIFIPYNIATSIALIVNELVNNCLKHAFPGKDNGTIHVSCMRDNEQIVIMVKDDGVGLPEKFNMEKTNRLGLTILQGIVSNELQGKMELKTNSGTIAEIHINTQNIFKL